MLFLGASLQQYAIAYTTASKAAFLTALYVVLVPLLGLFVGERLSLTALGGVICAIIGAGLLSLKDSFIPSYGDRNHPDFHVVLGHSHFAVKYGIQTI